MYIYRWCLRKWRLSIQIIQNFDLTRGTFENRKYNVGMEIWMDTLIIYIAYCHSHWSMEVTQWPIREDNKQVEHELRHHEGGHSIILLARPTFFHLHSDKCFLWLENFFFTKVKIYLLWWLKFIYRIDKDPCVHFLCSSVSLKILYSTWIRT